MAPNGVNQVSPLKQDVKVVPPDVVRHVVRGEMSRNEQKCVTIFRGAGLAAPSAGTKRQAHSGPIRPQTRADGSHQWSDDAHSAIVLTHATPAGASGSIDRAHAPCLSSGMQNTARRWLSSNQAAETTPSSYPRRGHLHIPSTPPRSTLTRRRSAAAPSPLVGRGRAEARIGYPTPPPLRPLLSG